MKYIQLATISLLLASCTKYAGEMPTASDVIKTKTYRDWTCKITELQPLCGTMEMITVPHKTEPEIRHFEDSMFVDVPDYYRDAKCN